jgi:YD repeat-containing protein
MDSDNNPQTPMVAQSTIYKWTYDDADRLVSESIDSHFDEADRFERFDLDLFGNRIKSSTSKTPNATDIDRSIQYRYDLNDRLQSESGDDGNDGSVDQTTSYSWSGTQQSMKRVSV